MIFPETQELAEFGSISCHAKSEKIKKKNLITFALPFYVGLSLKFVQVSLAVFITHHLF